VRSAGRGSRSRGIGPAQPGPILCLFECSQSRRPAPGSEQTIATFTPFCGYHSIMAEDEQAIGASTTGRADIYMGNQLVGLFQSPALPTTDGAYRYEAYRSPGHLNLQTQLKAGKTPRCFYETMTHRVCFCVIANATPGVLDLAGFEVDNLDNSIRP